MSGARGDAFPRAAPCGRDGGPGDDGHDRVHGRDWDRRRDCHRGHDCRRGRGPAVRAPQ